MLDLAKTPYVDAGGLGEIVRSYSSVKREGGDLKLLNPVQRVVDLLTITKFIAVFEVYGDESNAVRSFSG